MKLRFYELDIRASELQTSRVSVASWEYPILQAIWGDAVRLVNEILVERDAPEPADEFRRLVTRYKSAEPGDAPFVAAVYGQFGPGVSALAQAIKAGIYEGGVTLSARPSQDVPAVGQVPAGLTRSVADIKAELLAAELAVIQETAGPQPLTVEQVEIVKAASPQIAEAVETTEREFQIDDDAAVAGLI